MMTWQRGTGLGQCRDGNLLEQPALPRNPAVQYLFSSYCEKTPGTQGAKDLKVCQVNRMLDQLVAAAGEPCGLRGRLNGGRRGGSWTAAGNGHAL